MARLTKLHSDFRHPGLSYLNFRLLDMDRVLTAFLARLQHRGCPAGWPGTPTSGWTASWT